MDLQNHTESKSIFPSDEESAANMCEIKSNSYMINKDLFRQIFNIAGESSSDFVKCPLFKSTNDIIFLLEGSIHTFIFPQYIEQFDSMESYMYNNQKLQKNYDFKSLICDNLSDVKSNELLFQNCNFMNLNANENFAMKMPHIYNHRLLYSTNHSLPLEINMLTVPWENFHYMNFKLKYNKYIYNVASNNCASNSHVGLKGSWQDDCFIIGLMSKNSLFESSTDNEIFKLGVNVETKKVENCEKCIIQETDVTTQMLPEKLSVTNFKHINAPCIDNMNLEEINSFKANDIEMEPDSENRNLSKNSKGECKIIYEDLSVKIVYEKLSQNLKSSEKAEEKKVVNEGIEPQKDVKIKNNENKAMVVTHPPSVEIGKKRSRSETPENKRSVKPRLEANAKRIEIDFVSEDPKENSDNFDPRWEKLKLLSKDHENFKLVRGRWGNLTPPNPFVDLTYRHKGNPANVGRTVERERPKIKLPKSRRKKGRSLSCVTYFERIINEMNNKCNEELRALRNRLEVELLRIDFQQKMKKLELYGAMYPECYNNLPLTSCGQEKERERAVKEYCEVQRQITERRNSYVFFYKKYMTEVRAFCTSSDNTGHDDKLSDEQILHWDETERMYSEYAKFYC